jgi:hypothetical protein
MFKDKLDKVIFEALVPRYMEDAEAKLTPSLARLGFHPADVEKRRILTYKSDGPAGKASFHKTPEGFKLTFHVPTIIKNGFPGEHEEFPTYIGDVADILDALEQDQDIMSSAIANGSRLMSTFNFKAALPALLRRVVGPTIDKIKEAVPIYKERTKYNELGSGPRGRYMFSVRPYFKFEMVIDIEPGHINNATLTTKIFRDLYVASQLNTPFQGGFEEMWNALGKFREEVEAIPFDGAAEEIIKAVERNKNKRPPRPRRRFN